MRVHPRVRGASRAGGRQVRRVARLLAGRVPADARIRPLYGNLAPAAQDAAVLPEPDGAAPGGARARRRCAWGRGGHLRRRALAFTGGALPAGRVRVSCSFVARACAQNVCVQGPMPRGW